MPPGYKHYVFKYFFQLTMIAEYAFLLLLYLKNIKVTLKDKK